MQGSVARVDLSGPPVAARSAAMNGLFDAEQPVLGGNGFHQPDGPPEGGGARAGSAIRTAYAPDSISPRSFS
jgi:hypothetical protein